MAGIYGYSREACKVKVKKCETNTAPEWRKFSVDPQITSLEVLYSILTKAFDIKSDFGISYRTLDPSGQEIYLGVVSDWDLDAAFLRAHNLSIQTNNEPCLNLRVDIKAFSEATDWEVNSPASKEISSFQQSIGVGQKYVQTMQIKLPGLIMNQMEKTFSMVQRALNLMEDQLPIQPPRQPLSDSEFRNFLDSVGQIIQPNELRKVIFSGGIDPSLRRVVWKHILNVYPFGMTGRERMDYMKRKASEYYRLRDNWRSAVQHGPVIGELAYVTSMVRKDVLRTDRLHPFYAGSDDNQNIASLFNILTTYALNHPSVSYCQGMSDIASPLLVTMGDEAHAYICFCAIMSRLKGNFMLDGIAMTQKFTHLSEALQFYDPEFYEYLKAQQADDLLFCYRWLLLEMKREFAFEDSLRMLEVLWSSLRIEPPSKELELIEKEFIPPSTDIPPPKSPSIIMRTPRENAYTKVCALRRQSSSISLLSNSPNQTNLFGSPITTYNKLDATKRMNQSLDENISRITNQRRVTKAHQSLDETKMLMLMENITAFETNSNLKSNKNITDNFEMTNQISTIIDDNSAQIIFHPTNPFIDDAQQQLQEQQLKDNSYIIENANDNENQNTVDDDDNYENTTINLNITNNNNQENLNISPKNIVSITNKTTLYNNKLASQKASIKLTNKTIFSCNASNIISKQLNNKKGGHFKDLKEKIAASKKGILASLEKIDNQNDTTLIINNPTTEQQAHQQLIDDCAKFKTNNKNNQKIVKNFNEFLNFASINKSRISDKLVTNNKVQLNTITYDRNDKDVIMLQQQQQQQQQQRPLIKLTKNSFDDSDSSTTFDSNIVTTTQYQTVSEHIIKPPLQLHLTNIVAQTQLSLDGSSPDDSQDYFPMTTSMTRELRLEVENLDRQVFGDAGIVERNNKLLNDTTEICYEKLDKDSLDLVEVREEEIVKCPDANDFIVLRSNNTEKKNNIDQLKRISTCSTNTDVFIWENPLHQMSGASSCNFNDDIIESNKDHDDDENAIHGYTNGNQDLEQQQFSNAMTPDEQQDLEYDGDIILECFGDDIRKSVTTPLKLIQQKMSTTTSKLRDDSDSENTDSWKQQNDNNNPFLIGSSSSCNKILSSSIRNYQDSSFIEEQEDSLTTSTITGTVLQQNQQSSEIMINPQLGEEAAEANIISYSKVNNILPSPNEFGGGNPFLMFLCLTLLLQHRNFVMKSGMDYNEMAMHFDKMVRKHDVTRVLNQARRMYSDYLKTQTAFLATASGSSCGKNDISSKIDGPTKSSI